MGFIDFVSIVFPSSAVPPLWLAGEVPSEVGVVRHENALYDGFKRFGSFDMYTHRTHSHTLVGRQTVQVLVLFTKLCLD